MKKIRTWILIADGAHARILVNEGPGKGVTPVPDASFSIESLATNEIGTDRPGRVNDSLGGQRHAMEPRVDWHRQQKARFLQDMAKKIDEAARGDSFDRLVLVAPPKALGDLRGALGRQASDLVSAELAKDLTTIPLNDLPGHLTDVVSI